MALYNKFFGDYDKQTGDDDYHGEYADDAYGSLYIPHIEEQLASMTALKRIFLEKKIGDVTTVTFSELVIPLTYKGKSKKKAYSAIVYLKWYENTVADALRQAIWDGDKKNAHINVDAKQHWVTHYNTVFSDEVCVEHYYNVDSEDTAVDMALRILDDTAEDLHMYDLEDTAVDMAMRVFSEHF